MQQRPSALEAHDVELVGYHDLAGRPGFKMALSVFEERWYLYLAHFWHSGWTVLDVTDPHAPELVRFVAGPPDTRTMQVQVADGLLVAGLERPKPGWGRDPSDRTEEGIHVYDVSGVGATDPVLLGSFATGGRGTHRNFYAGGRYAYLTACPDGFVDNMLLVVDLDDPTRPTEVGRWWWPGQHSDDGVPAEHERYFHGPAHVDGDLAYLGYGGVGMVILDVSDVRRPTLVSRVSFGDLGSPVGCHSVVPLHGTSYVIVNSEAIAEGAGEHLNYVFVVDVVDPARPRIAAWFPTPIPTPGLPYRNYFAKGGRFGPHNQHHHQGQAHLWQPRRHVVMTYFNAGLRVFDLEDPLVPREVGHFVPTDPTERIGVLPKTLVSQSEDVLVDARGNIFCTDKNLGLMVLRYGPGLE